MCQVVSWEKSTVVIVDILCWNHKLYYYIVLFKLSLNELYLFWFSRKIAHTHISSRQNKNKLKEEHHFIHHFITTSLYTSFVSVNFGKNMRQLHSIWMYKSYVHSLQLYPIPSVKQYTERIWGHCYKGLWGEKNGWLRTWMFSTISSFY